MKNTGIRGSYAPNIRSLLAALAIVALGFVSLTCSSPFTVTLISISDHANGPTVTTPFRDGMGINPGFEIKVKFATHDGYPTVMRKDTLVLGGTMAAEAADPVWDSEYDYVVYIRPKTVWSSQAKHTISVTCADENGYTCTLNRVFGVLDGVIYVSMAGTASGSGRIDDPLDDVQYATWLARWMYPDDPSLEIRVAEGRYATYYKSIEDVMTLSISFREEYDGYLSYFGSKVYLGSSMRLLGGYSQDFSSRDPTSYETVITNPTGVGSSDTLWIYDCPEATLVDGFTIESSGNAVYAYNSPVTITHNRIVGSLVIDGGTVLVEDNALETIECSESDVIIRSNMLSSDSWNSITSISIYGSQAMIEGNETRLKWGQSYNNLTGKNVTEHIGIALKDSTGTIRNNVIDAGIAATCIGIYNAGSSPLIQNNTIYAGSGIEAFFGSYSRAMAIWNGTDDTGTVPSKPTVQNNLLFVSGDTATGLHALYSPDGSDQSVVENNCFSGFPAAETAAYDGIDGNLVEVNIFDWLANPAWTLQANAPASIRTGGKDLSAQFSTDKAGVSRPAGSWSKGAYQ